MSEAAADWKAGLPEDLKGEACIKDVPDVPTLVKNYREAMSYRGSSVRIPGPDASEEDWSAFDAKVKERVPGLLRLPKDEAKQAEALRGFGLIPKEAKDYSLDGATIPEGVAFSDEQLGEMRKAAAKLGLTKAAFKELVQDRAAAMKAAAEASQAGKAALKKEWGEAYTERLAAVQGLVEQTNAPQELKDAVAKGEFSAGVASWLVNMAKSLGTPTREVAKQGDGNRPAKLTPREAQIQVKEGIKKASDPNLSPEEREEVMARVRELMAQAHPDLS